MPLKLASLGGLETQVVCEMDCTLHIVREGKEVQSLLSRRTSDIIVLVGGILEAEEGWECCWNEQRAMRIVVGLKMMKGH